jgi:hypothetical protein
MSSRESEMNVELILVNWLGLERRPKGNREAKCPVDGEDVDADQVVCL